MTNPANRSSGGAAQRLDLRTRRVLEADGTVTERATVHCPAHDASVHVEACSTCGRGAGLHFDMASRTTTVQCRVPLEGTSGEPATPASKASALRAEVSTPISLLMARDVVCVRPDTSLEDLTALLLEQGLSGVPVVDAAGKPIGIVSKTDLLRAERDRADTTEEVKPRVRTSEGLEVELGSGFHVVDVPRGVASDVMTSVVLALNESEPIGHAGALMAFEGVHRLVAISDDGEVVGVLSSLDILRWLGQKSGYVLPEPARSKPGAQSVRRDEIDAPHATGQLACALDEP